MLLGVEAVTLAGSDCARSVRTKLAPLGAWVVASGSVIAEPKRETRAPRGYEVWPGSIGVGPGRLPLLRERSRLKMLSEMREGDRVAQARSQVLNV